MRDIILPDAILLDMDAVNKKEAIQLLANHAARLSGRDAHVIFDILWEREKLGTTGVGQGIAIPHGRVEKLDKVLGIFARFVQPIDYESVDGRPVDLVFLLLAPESAGADHLHALATVSRALREPKLCEKLRTAKDAAAVYKSLTEGEAAEAA